MRRRYPFLRILSAIFAIMGVVIAVLTVVGFITIEILIFSGHDVISELSIPMVADLFGVVSQPLALNLLFSGILATITSWASSEFIMLLIHIEENTRMAQLTLRQRDDGTLRSVSEYPQSQPMWDDPNDPRKVLPRLGAADLQSAQSRDQASRRPRSKWDVGQ